jgi:ribonuclease P protein component
LSRQTLGRDRRLLDRRALEQTLTTGQVARSRYFTLRYLRGDGPPEVAFVAGRKVGKAVRRNRARRVLREAFRTCGLELPGTATLVFIASDRAATASYEDVKEAVAGALRRITDHTD